MTNARSWKALLPWMTAFAVAMAFLESAVVVDLRALYYPHGFAFPLVALDRRIAATELVRELATLVMLLAPGALVTRHRLERFAWFCYGFAVWDLFYYVFLKAILGWPVSLFTWDILFLLPVVWVGPVLAPCLVSVGLAALGLLLLHKRAQAPAFRPSKRHWSALVGSGILLLYTFLEEPLRHLRAKGSGLRADAAMAALQDYLPAHFDWPVFLIGLALALWALIDLARRHA